MKINLAWFLPIVAMFVVAAALMLLAVFVGVPLDKSARSAIMVGSIIAAPAISLALTFPGVSTRGLTVIIEFDENGALTIRRGDG